MKYKIIKLISIFFIFLLFSFLSYDNVSAQVCGQGTISIVQGCNQDKTTGQCVSDVTTTTYNCSWNGNSCIGLESSGYCDSNCNFINGDLIEIPCGGGSGGGGGTANNCPAGQVPTYYNPPQYSCMNQCSLPNRDSGDTCGPGGTKPYCEVGYCAAPTPAPTPTCGATSPVINSITQNGSTVTVKWTPGVGGTQQLIRIGANLSEVNTGCQGLSSPACLVSTSVTSATNTYTFTANLTLGTTYYFRIVDYKDSTCYNDDLNTYVGCPLTAPTINTINQAGNNTTMTWTPGTGGGVSQLIRVGANFNEVNTGCAGTYSPACVAAATLANGIASYTVTNPLTVGTDYYFRVVNYHDPACYRDYTQTYKALDATCSITSPTITSVIRNTPTSATINWTPGVGGVNQKLYVSQDPNQINNNCTLATSPGCVINQTNLPSSQSSYSTGNTLASGTVYYIKVVNYNYAACQRSSDATNTNYTGGPLPYLSSCILTRSRTDLQVGESDTVVSSINTNSIISKVDFQSSNPSIISITSVTPDTTSPYTATIRADSAGSATIQSTVYFSNNSIACTNVPNANTSTGGDGGGGGGGGSNGDTPIVVTNLSESWWQVVDSDLTSNGALQSTIPSGQTFGLDGAGGYAGIPTYTTTITGITPSNVSTDHWLTQNSNNTNPVFDYDYFANQIPADVTFNTISSSSISGSTFASGGTSSYGYYWYRYDGGAGNLPLTINSAVDVGSRRVILLVDNASLNINSNINLTDGVGFFMTIVDNNINIDPTVGGGSGPNLEGFFVADNRFNTGIGTNQLRVRGAVVAYDGITLSRDLGTGNATTPGEQFEYAPDQSILFPSKLATRKISWKEIAP